MKRTIALIIAAVTFLCAAMPSGGEPKCDHGWREKMMSEKIAFLTIEMDLTPEEAQKFWPVYNRHYGKQDAAMHETFEAFRALEEAIEAGKPAQEIGTLLDKYLAAQEKQRELDDEAAEQYKSVLPVEKVAKLFIGEEKFRRQHIRRLHEKQGSKE